VSYRDRMLPCDDISLNGAFLFGAQIYNQRDQFYTVRLRAEIWDAMRAAEAKRFRSERACRVTPEWDRRRR